MHQPVNQSSTLRFVERSTQCKARATDQLLPTLQTSVYWMNWLCWCQPDDSLVWFLKRLSIERTHYTVGSLTSIDKIKLFDTIQSYRTTWRQNFDLIWSANYVTDCLCIDCLIDPLQYIRVFSWQLDWSRLIEWLVDWLGGCLID